MVFVIKELRWEWSEVETEIGAFNKSRSTTNPFLAGAGIGALLGKYCHWFLKNEVELILSRKSELFLSYQGDLSFKHSGVRH